MRISLLFFLLLPTFWVFAQDEQGYRTPPKDIMDLVLAKPTPSVNIDSKGEWMLLLDRSPLPSVEELAQPELRIAGIRINPNNFGPSRAVYTINFQLKNIKTGEVKPVNGLPENLRASALQWNPSEKKIAFIHSTNKNISLWVIDVATQTASQATGDQLNAVLGAAYIWAGDDEILYKAVTKQLDQQPARPPAPTGPIVQENLGKAAASRTYQDLIKSTYDEALFEFYGTAQVKKLSLAAKKTVTIGQPGIYGTWNLSPSKQYLLVREINKPFSYLFPWLGFPHTIKVVDASSGTDVRVLAKNPSNEGQPIGFDDVVNLSLIHI